MTITDLYGSHFVQSLGVDRVVLGRELSLDDISKIWRRSRLENNPVEVEAFVHGALCGNI